MGGNGVVTSGNTWAMLGQYLGNTWERLEQNLSTTWAILGNDSNAN